MNGQSGCLLLLAVLFVPACRTSPHDRSDTPNPRFDSGQPVGPVTAIVCEGDWLASCSQSGVRIDESLVALEFRPVDLALTSSGVLVGGGKPGRTGEVTVLTRAGEVMAHRQVSEDLVYKVAVSPDGHSAAAGCADGTLVILKLPSLELVRRLSPHTAPVRALQFSADGTRLTSGGLDGLVCSLVLASEEIVVFAAHTSGVESLRLVDGVVYSGSVDGKVRVHTRSRLIRSYLGLGYPVVDLLPVQGKMLALLSSGDVVELLVDSDQVLVQHRFGTEVFALAACPYKDGSVEFLAGLSGKLVKATASLVAF